ncbi:MAG: lactate racemase domain-containing protein [Promethearchaeota archaeon]
MKKIRVRYGKGHISLKIPEQNLAQVIQPRKTQASRDIAGTIRQALLTPKGPTLQEIIANRRVCVLIEDGTRSEPHEIIVEELARQISAAKELTFIITTGSHETDSPRNREIAKAIHDSCQNHKLEQYKVIIHDGLESPCRLVGTTSRGTPVKANQEALEKEAYVIAADMKNHYFAGYSNPIKNLLPGICNFASIEANHSLALEPESTFGRHPLHPDHSRRSNPVAEDMLEAAQMILSDQPTFVLATITSGPYILWASSGDLAKVAAEGFTKIDKAASFTVPPTDHIIVSPGGFPQDESLYNAQRGLELTRNAVNEGGEILFLAECVKGVAPTPKARTFFFDQLTQPLPEVISSIQREYKLYTHKAYKFAQLIQHVNNIWVHTNLSQTQVKAAHLQYTPKPQTVIDNWIKHDTEAQILVFNEANKIAVYAETPSK